MKKKLLSLFLIVTMLILGLNNAKAADSINVVVDSRESGKRYVLIDSTGKAFLSGDYSQSSYTHILNKYLKSDESKKYVCVSGMVVDPSNDGTCTVTSTVPSSAKGKEYAIAYILNAIESSNLDSLSKYYWKEVTVLQYLAPAVDNNFSFVYPSNTVNSTSFLGIGKTINTIKSEATNYQTKASKTVSIGFNESKISFSLSSDGTKYISKKVYVNDNNQNTDSISFTKGGDTGLYTLKEGTENGKRYFQIEVPKSNVSSKTVNISVTATGQYKRYKSIFYNCKDNQGVFANPQDYVTFTSENVSGKSTITGSLSKGKLIIKKVDENNNLVAGADIKVTGPNNYSKTITTSTTETVINDLDLDVEYTVEEIKAPNGYILSSNPIKFKLTSSSLTYTATITNKSTKVTISKTSMTDKKILPGATLEIQDSTGKVVSYCVDSKGNKNTACRWVSTDKAYEVEAFPNGTYYLVEISSPDGYILNTEKVKFVVDGSIENVKVNMENKLTQVEISKISAETGKLLEGATLEIQDSTGKVVSYCVDEEGNKGKECKWVSTDENYVINGIPYGEYYLVEVSAPKGYELNKDKIKFVVDNSKEVVKVEMKNIKHVDVPDTLSGKSALLIAFAMFDIALGIGIITYVKKNKVTE